MSSTVSASQCQVFMPSKESMEPSLSYSLIAQNPLQGSERLGNCHYIGVSSHTQLQSTVAKFTKFLLFALVKVGLRACLVFILYLSCQSVFKHCSEVTMVHCSSVDSSLKPLLPLLPSCVQQSIACASPSLLVILEWQERIVSAFFSG